MAVYCTDEIVEDRNKRVVVQMPTPECGAYLMSHIHRLVDRHINNSKRMVITVTVPGERNDLEYETVIVEGNGEEKPERKLVVLDI